MVLAVFLIFFQAEKIGLVARVTSPDQLLPEAEKLASEIASMSLPVIKHAKKAILSSLDLPLSQGTMNACTSIYVSGDILYFLRSAYYFY